jgi:putative transposase
VYEKDIEPATVDPALAAGIDIGLDNLAAITANKPGFVPVHVNGAYNILRKAIPEAFGQGKAGVVVHPVGTAPTH